MEIRKISYTVFVLSSMIGDAAFEQFPRSVRGTPYFQMFEDLGKLAHLSRSPKYSKIMLELNTVLSKHQFLGIDKLSNVRAIGKTENRENGYLLLGKRAVEGSSLNTDTTVEGIVLSNLGNVRNQSSDSTDTGQRLNSSGVVTTSGEFKNKSDGGTSMMVSTSLPESSSLPGTSHEVPVSTSLPGTREDVPVTTSLPGSREDVPVTTSIPGTSPDVPVTTSLPGTREDVPVTTSLPGTREEVPVTTSLPGTREEVPVTTSLPGTREDVPGTTSLPGTIEDVPVSTSLPGTREDVPVTTSVPGTIEDVTVSTPVPIAQCAHDTERVFSSFQYGEQWSLKFIDSWGKPGAALLLGQFKFVGSYQECRRSWGPPSSATGSDGFSGNYCAVKMASPPGEAGEVNVLAVTAAVEIGACLPSSCSAEEVFGLVDEGLRSANLSNFLVVTSVDCRTDEREITAATIASIVFLAIIGAFMIFGTAFDLLFVQWRKWAETIISNDYPCLTANEKANGYHPIGAHDTNGEARFLLDEEKHVITNIGNDYSAGQTGAVTSLYSESKPLLRKKPSGGHTKSACFGILYKVLMAFSVFSNGKKLLNTSKSAGSLGSIHGIRFFSMSWVILGHAYLFPIDSFGNLATALTPMLSRWTFDAVSNALVSVDTFFALSGLLTSYLTTKEIQKKGWKLNWAMYYFHRFWRLTPPYMLVLLTILGLTRFMGSGATWSSTQPLDKTNCEDNWWTNLIYVNNFVHSKQMCMGHSWYLANDMQFHILSPLLIVPFFFNVYAGLGINLVILLVNWTTAGVLSTNNQWRSSELLNTVRTDGSLDYQSYYYIVPYCRIGPFVVGILSGYLLAATKGRINLKWYHVIIGWVVAISVGLASVYGIHGDVTGQDLSSVGVSALYNAVARSAWGACVCWVIVACACGYGGPVNSILSWSPFVSLGRLTYMAYLIHPTVIRAYFGNMEQTFYLNDTNFVISFLGLLVFTNMASFVLVLGFESPMIGLEKVFLRH